MMFRARSKLESNCRARVLSVRGSSKRIPHAWTLLAQNIDSCVCRSRLTFFTVQHPSTIWSCIKHRDFFHGTWFTNWFHLIAVVLSASSVEHLSISEFLTVLNYKVLQLFTYPSLDNRYCEKVLKSALFLMFARKQRTNRNVSNYLSS